MTFEYKFKITTPIEVYESLGPSKMRLTGTFIRLNIPTVNGRIYQVQESEQIIKDLKGKAVYLHGNRKGEHVLADSNLIGKVVDVFVNNDVIRGIVEIWNNSKFPNLLARVREGWGFSIGGTVKAFNPTGYVNRKLRPIVHAIGMRANHLQLLEPTERRGDLAAQVEGLIPVMETFKVEEGEVPPVADVTTDDHSTKPGDEFIKMEDLEQMRKDLDELKEKMKEPEVPEEKPQKRRVIKEEILIRWDE